MPIKHAMMGLLSRGPVHGYDLKNEFEAAMAPDGELNFGQVYSTLDRLRRAGLVGQRRVSQNDRPDKKVYQLTAAGRSELARWLSSPQELSLELRNETYLKLMVARRLDWADPLEVLAVERRGCLTRLHELLRAKAKAEADGAPVQTLLLLELGLHRIEAFAKWLDRCEEILAKERA